MSDPDKSRKDGEGAPLAEAIAIPSEGGESSNPIIPELQQVQRMTETLIVPREGLKMELVPQEGDTISTEQFRTDKEDGMAILLMFTPPKEHGGDPVQDTFVDMNDLCVRMMMELPPDQKLNARLREDTIHRFRMENTTGLLDEKNAGDRVDGLTKIYNREVGKDIPLFYVSLITLRGEQKVMEVSGERLGQYMGKNNILRIKWKDVTHMMEQVKQLQEKVMFLESNNEELNEKNEKLSSLVTRLKELLGTANNALVDFQKEEAATEE